MEHKYHTLRRVRGSKHVYQCADPTCNWRDQKKFMIGKIAICYRCNGEYILDSYALSLARPHCIKCNKGERGKNQSQGEEIGQDLLKRLGVAS